MSYGGAYSWCQQIYRASELAAANVPAGAVIISISFYNATGATTMSDIRTYMGHCTNDYFSGTSDWAPYSTLTLVDSGDWVAPAGWFDINLDAPFVWDGTSNLVIGVSFRGAHSDYSTNNPNCGYRYTSQGGSAHIRRYSTTLSSCDPTSTAAANSVSANRPNLMISYIVSGCASLTPSVANIQPYSADLSWFNFQQSVNSWDLMYGEAGTFDTLSGGTTVTNITDTFYYMTGLNSGTTYAVYMKPHCSSEEGSWSAPRVFTTLAACPTPNNLILMSHTAEEATISWLPGASETGWEVACVPHGQPVYTVTPVYVSSSPYTISNLTDDTQYDVYVRADCGNGENSYWTSAITFTTDPYCTSATNVHASQVQGTSALITWNSALVGATGYTVGYSEAGLDSWTTELVTGTSYMLSGLDPNTSYEVFVLSMCDLGDADSVFASFTTSCLVGGDLAIGNGTTTSSYIPSYSTYENGYTQQLFTATEMGGAANINSISFEMTAVSQQRHFKIYLMHTTSSDLTSGWLPASNATLVYDAPHTFATGWNTFNFSTPFSYDGTSNLLLIVIDSNDSWSGGNTWRTHSAFSGSARYTYQDNTQYSINNVPSAAGTALSTRNNVIFGVPCDSNSTCASPNVYIADVTDESIEIGWAPGYTESSWELEYSDDASNWISEGVVSTSPYTISNLTANTLYYIRLRGNCGGGEFSDWAGVSVRTACADVATLPMMENFDSYAGATTTSVSVNNLPYCWSYLNEGTSTTYSGYPIIYASATYAASGSNSIRFYTYTTSGTYDDQIAILPSIDVDVNPINTLQLSLDVRALSATYVFNLDVGIMTDPTDRNTFVTLQTIQTQSTTYANYEVPFSQYVGTGKYIAIRASQPTSGYNYGYVDNIRVEPIPECPKPINVSSTVATTNSITLNWTEVGTATSWLITYGPTGFTPGTSVAMTETVYENPYTVTGLSASMGYDFYVQSDCGSNYSNMSNVYTAATQCDMITALPLMENFDSYTGASSTSVSVNNLPYCWSNLNTGTSTSYSGYPIIYASATYAASGNNAMRFYTYTTSGTYSDQTAILPQIDVNTFPINTLQLTFDARQNSTSYPFTLVVGVMTNPTVASSFTPVQTVTVSSTSYSTFEVPLTQYAGTGAYIAIKAPQPTSGYNYGYVDNIILDIAPLCVKPTNVTASNITATTADINWMPGGSENAWEVVVVPTGMSITTGTAEPVSAHPYTLTNLNDNTAYDVYVRADCGTGTDFSSWSQVCHFTTPPLCSAPTNVSVTQIAGTSALISWNEAIFGATGYTVAYTETGMDSWTTQTVTGTSFMLSGLSPETPYTVTVTSVCDEGTAPAVTKNFTTGCLFGGDNIVGTGTSTSYNIPLNTFYNYSYVQQLYLASEINNSGDIHSIGFQYIYTTAQTKNNQYIYLAETDLTSLSTWVPADSLTLVYSGSINYNNNGPDNWVTITLDSAFNYSGTRNLVVVVKNDHGNYTTSSNNTFKTHSATGMTLQYYTDSSPFSMTSPSSPSTYSSRNNIKFGMECDNTVTCIAPNVYVESVTETSITLNWAPGNNESSWDLETSTDGTTWNPEATVTTSPYTLSNLTANTLYHIRLRSNCGGGEFSNWATTSHRTECAAISTLPFMENFDSYAGATSTSVSVNNLPNCWSFFNEGTSTSYSGYPIIYSSSTYAASGSNAMRFYTYTTSGTYDDQVAILPIIDVATLPLNTLQLSFDARQNSTSYPFVLEIGVMTDPTDINTFMVVSTVTSQSTTYANYEIPLNQYTGSGAYIAIKAPQPTSGYNYGYVDNVVVEAIPSCPKPTQLQVVNTTNNSIELGWTENGTATSWVIEYGPAGFTPGNGTTENATTNPYTINNLTASTQYDFYVKADCGGGDLSNYSAVLSTSTECDAITQLPYTEGFDTYGTGTTTYPLCWGRINTYTSGDRPYVNSTHYEGVGSLYFYATSPTYNIAVAPQFDASIPVNTLQASFMYRASNSTDRLIVGVMTNASDASTFVPVDTVYPGSTVSTWVQKEVSFSNYTGTGQYIAFYNGNPSASCYAYIDNLEIDVIPTCPKPQNLSIVDATINSIQLQWTEIGSATSWEIAYGAPGFDLDDASATTLVTANTNPFTITNLNSSTTYQFYVRALCSSTDISNWSNSLQASTTMTPTPLPYTANFSDPNDAWVLNNGNCVNYWVKGTVNNEGALFVTDNGTTPNYTITSTSVVAAQKLFTVGTSDSITITFDVEVQGESSFDYMKLFLAPASEQFPASTAAPGSSDYGYNSYSTYAYDFYTNGYGTQTSYHYILNLVTGTAHVVATMPNPNASPTSTSTALLVFAWKNDPSVGTQPPATITNLSVTENGSGPVITNPTVATNAATAIAQTTATLNGTITNPDNVTITAKGFEWKATAGGTYQPVTVTGNNLTYNLTGLTANTGYTYKAFITFNGTTVYGNEVTFTTLDNDVEPCNVPTGLTAGTITHESIAISWNNDANVNSWNIQYRPVGGTLASATSTTNSYTITGLTPETEYQIQVQADCGDGNVSDWTAAISATTTTGIENHLLNNISLYPNPAKEYIDVRVDEFNVSNLEVYDVYGKLINTVNVIDNPTRINVSNLAAGMYFVRVTTEEGVATKSFVKK